MSRKRKLEEEEVAACEKRKKVKIQSLLANIHTEYDTFVDIFSRQLQLEELQTILKPFFKHEAFQKAFHLEYIVHASVHMNRKRYHEKCRSLIQQLKLPRAQEIIACFARSFEDMTVWVAMDMRSVVRWLQLRPVLGEKVEQKRLTKEDLVKECLEEMAKIREKALEGQENVIYLMCRVCKSQNIEHVARQVRSADEGMSMFCKCNDCGKKWREN
jgi:DNA-directed RNA polymerase subunit M/transcription elongation factor TFIIS